MAITVQLTPEEEARLRSIADQLKVSPEALAESAVRALLARPDDEFLQVAQIAVAENRQLYERLR